MQHIPTMACADGDRRASNAFLFGIPEIYGATPNPTVPIAKTAAYTCKIAESGCAFSNVGASGSVTFTLPTTGVKAGMFFIFYRVATQNVVISGAIQGGTTATCSTSTYGSIVVVAISSTAWQIHSALGTWTVA